MTELGDNGFEEGVEDSGRMSDTGFEQSVMSGNGGAESDSDTKRDSVKRDRSRSRSPARNNTDNRRRDRGDRADRRDRDRRRDRGQPNKRSQIAIIVDQRTGKQRRVNYEYCVFISNISYDVGWSELKTLLGEKVGPVAYVECFDNDDGKPSGCAFVEFKEKDSAVTCLRVMEKYDLRGRKLVVKSDLDGHYSGKFRRRKEQEMRAKQLLTPQLLRSLDLDPDFLTDTIFVANLFYKMDWRDVKDVFKVAGPIERVEVFKDKDGKSKGLATIKYESVVDAVNAICMLNGRMLHEREIHVRMDREKAEPPRGPPKPRPPPIPRGLDSMGPSLEQIAQGMGQGGPSNMGGGRMGGSGMGSPGMGGLGGSRMGAAGMGGGLMGSGGLGTGLGMSGVGGMQGLGGGLGGGGLGSPGLLGGIGAGLQGSSLGMGSAGSALNLGGGIGLGNLNPGLGSLGGMSSGGLGGNSSLGGLGGDLGSSDFRRLSSSGGSMGVDRLSSDLSPRFGSMRDDRDMGQSRGGSSRFSNRDNFSQRDFGGRDRDMDRGGMGNDRGGRDRMGSGSGGGGHQDRDRGRSSGGGNMVGTPKEGGCQVFVRNLPFSVDWNQLKEAFKDIGRVMYADVKTDEQNRSKGYGTVRFERSEEAFRAISIMNGQNFKGRMLDVSLDRY